MATKAIENDFIFIGDYALARDIVARLEVASMFSDKALRSPNPEPDVFAVVAHLRPDMCWADENDKIYDYEEYRTKDDAFVRMLNILKAND